MATAPTNLERGTQPIPLARRFGAGWEQVSPWLIAAFGGVLLWIWDPPTSKTALAIERFLSGSIDAAAVLAGFQLTALTLLLSIADKPIVKRLKDTGFYNRLIAFHWQAIMSLLVWLLVSMTLLVIQGGTVSSDGKVVDLERVTRWSGVALTVSCLAAICSSIRVTRLLVKLLRASG